MEGEIDPQSSEQKRILLVEGDSSLIGLFQAATPKKTIRIDRVASQRQILDRVPKQPYDLILTDSRESAIAGLELLSSLVRFQPGARVMVLARDGSVNDILEAIRRHAFSCFISPFDPANVVGMMISSLELPVWEDGLEVLHGRPDWISMKVGAQLVTAERAYQFCKELLIGVPESIRDKTSTAFRELLLNAIEYGAGFNPGLAVEVSLVRTHRALVFQIKDPGPGFSLTALPHAAISNPPDQPIAHMQYRMEKGMRDGGFGILIAQELVDELHFNATGNEVMLIKYLN